MRFSDALTISPKQLTALVKQQPMKPHIPTQPSAATIPTAWAQNFMPPGMPLVPMGWNFPSYRADPNREPRVQSRITRVKILEELGDGRAKFEVVDEQGSYSFTPRAFQFPPNVNTSITPRVSYSLMSFSDIQALSEDTPDVMACPFKAYREFLNLVPRIVHRDGEICDDDDLNRILKYPDGYHPLPVWLYSWFYNNMIYDAPALFWVRGENGMIDAMVNVDGSTIFTLIDENGNPPKPPAPAYLQIIWGTPYGFASTEQLWYRPNRKRINAPYGTTLCESANLPVRLLNNIWKYQTASFETGTLPDSAFTAPQGWSNDQVAAWLIEKNNALAGHPELRTQFDVWPFGFEVLDTKAPQFKRELYDIAKRELMEHAGFGVSELGDTKGQGLIGGRGFVKAMTLEFYRKTLGPWMALTKAPFNDVLRINQRKCKADKTWHEMIWDLPNQSVDPEEEQKRNTAVFQSGGMTLGAYRDAVGQGAFPENDPRNTLMCLPKGATLVTPEGKVWAEVKSVGDAESGKPPPKVPPGTLAGQMDKPDKKVPNLGKSAQETGVMVALHVPEDVSRKLLAALPPGVSPEREDELHITLAYLGDLAEVDAPLDRAATLALLRVFASRHAPLRGQIGGIAQFNSEGRVPLVALFDSPELPAFRQDLIDILKAGGCALNETHGFTAHITLAYLPADQKVDVKVESIPLTFDAVTLAWQGNWTRVPLGLAKSDLAKSCGTDAEDDAYFGAPLTRVVEIPMPHPGANGSEIVAATPAGLASRAFVFKSEGSEYPALVKSIGHPQYVSEEAVYHLDRALGLYLVPVAFVAEVDGERGAAVHFVKGSERQASIGAYGSSFVEGAAVLDFISGQTDRAHHNYLDHPRDTTRPVLFDNGLGFPDAQATRSIASAFIDAQRGLPLSVEMMDNLNRLADNGRMWARVTELVGSAAEPARERLALLLEQGTIPDDA